VNLEIELKIMAFSGKRVLVTGGANGLGLEIVRKFHGSKATVLILDHDVNQLAKVKAEFPDVITIVADLGNWDETRKAVEKVLSTGGPIHHLVNNAAVDRRESFMDASPENFDYIFGINVKAIMNVSQVVAKGLIDAGVAGTIVNISSVYGKFAIQNVEIPIYCATKASVTMLTKCMALELGPKNIRVNAVCPQYMITNMTREYIGAHPDTFETIINRQAIKRFLKPEETADSVLFLSSPSSSMITGHDLYVDGGYTIN
jgi:NAD(P)-dependent dehydrogenase (short-subunit alcohol dehydrogenase family)